MDFQDEVKNPKLNKLCIRASIATSVPQNFRVEENKARELEKFRIGVLGASGYIGSEVVPYGLFEQKQRNTSATYHHRPQLA